MGMFDTYVGTIKCPKCGKIIKFTSQTKDYDCALNSIEIGDIVDKANSSYFAAFSKYDRCVCDDCGEFDAWAVIKNGKLVAYINDIDDVDIEDFYKYPEVIDVIENHIKNYKDDIENDCNIYCNHNDKNMHDDKYEAIIDELRDVLEDIISL